eukprot:764809-Hanusia_phi.AAC.1
MHIFTLSALLPRSPTPSPSSLSYSSPCARLLTLTQIDYPTSVIRQLSIFPAQPQLVDHQVPTLGPEPAAVPEDAAARSKEVSLRSVSGMSHGSSSFGDMIQLEDMKRNRAVQVEKSQIHMISATTQVKWGGGGQGWRRRRSEMLCDGVDRGRRGAVLSPSPRGSRRILLAEEESERRLGHTERGGGWRGREEGQETPAKRR